MCFFLGQVIVRKGVTAILEALGDLKNEPVEFRMVGPVDMPLAPDIRNHPMLRWIGPVPRSQVVGEYQRADVFIFPTFSDGFGITQLEAQAWKLPVIASKNCGAAVRHLENGLVLPDVKSSCIVSAIRSILENPRSLEAMSCNSQLASSFTLNSLAARLGRLVLDELHDSGSARC